MTFPSFGHEVAKRKYCSDNEIGNGVCWTGDCFYLARPMDVYPVVGEVVDRPFCSPVTPGHPK